MEIFDMTLIFTADGKEKTISEKSEKTGTTMPSVPPPTKATTKTQSVSTHLPTESVTEKPKSLDKDATVVKVMTKYLGMPLKEFRKLCFFSVSLSIEKTDSKVESTLHISVLSS